jgi:hypothetical protein
MLREANSLNKPIAAGLPWLFGGLSFIVLKMFFDGAHDTYQEAVAGGQSTGDAFTQRVFLPSLALALTLGVALSLFAASDLLWPLIVLNDVDNFTVTLYIVRLLGIFAPGTSLIGSAVFYGGLIGLIFLPIVALLNVFVLDRLALIAGPVVSAEDATPTETEADATESDETGEDEPEESAD